MADNYFGFDRNKPAGFRLGRATESLDVALKGLLDERDTMIQMRDGDGTVDTHYAVVTTQYGFANDADAKGAFLELDSLVAKINTDASVSGVISAIKQFLARFRS